MLACIMSKQEKEEETDEWKGNILFGKRTDITIKAFINIAGNNIWYKRLQQS